MNTEQARDLLAEWARQGQEAAPPWEELPGIPLYMDQVILYLGESLELFQREGSSLLTSSMINNYVKTGLIPHPDKKKYTKELGRADGRVHAQAGAAHTRCESVAGKPV